MVCIVCIDHTPHRKKQLKNDMFVFSFLSRSFCFFAFCKLALAILIKDLALVLFYSEHETKLRIWESLDSTRSGPVQYDHESPPALP